jgi:hypothetical protein
LSPPLDDGTCLNKEVEPLRSLYRNYFKMSVPRAATEAISLKNIKFRL